MYLACIRCSDRMTRRNFGGSSGVLIDVCKDHGVWLDHTELERILEYVRSGGLARARQREALRAESQVERARQLSGASRPSVGDELGRTPHAGIDLLDVLGWLARELAGRLRRSS